MPPAAPTPTPQQRLEALCDPGSLELIRTDVRSSALGERAEPGDGVLGGAGRVGGRPVVCYAQDPAFLGGSLGALHADTIVRLIEIASRSRAPVVGFVASGGARMQEGVEALAGYGRIFRATIALAGAVPQISVITGTSAGGGAYAPALTDFLVMTAGSSMFLTGPGIVREALGEEVTKEQLGGPRVHEATGVCQLSADDDAHAVALVRELLDHLPSGGGFARRAPEPPAPGDPGEPVPARARKVYDIRDVIARLVDGGRLLEIAPRWARNMVCGFARLDGHAVGVVANQPRHLGGIIDAAAARKASRFVEQCSTFGIPLVVLVDTPGFLPGTGQERAGIIGAGAALLRAFSAAAVPRFTVIVRKAYGGAYITMNARDLGADAVFAWPTAELGVMSARSAVGLVHRRELREAADPEAERERLARAYAADHHDPRHAAARGHVDAIVEPSRTRAMLAWALGTRTATPAASTPELSIGHVARAEPPDMPLATGGLVA